MPRAGALTLAALGRAGVCAIDRVLQCYYGVFECTADPRCILRIARTRSPRDIVLSDGTRSRAGDPVLALHFWNERLAPTHGAASFAWGITLVRNGRVSLTLLAQCLQTRREFEELHALYGEMGCVPTDHVLQAQRVAAHLGFDLIALDPPRLDPRRYAFWQNVYSWCLMWTFNPSSLAGKSFAQLCCCELWMSRATLMEKYGKCYSRPTNRDEVL